MDLDCSKVARLFKWRSVCARPGVAQPITDAAPVYPAVLDEVVPSAWHHVERHANNRVEADHSGLKQRLRRMRGLRTNRTAQAIVADTRSCRTFAADATNSAPTPRTDSVSPQRSTSSPPPSERPATLTPTRPLIGKCNSARCRVAADASRGRQTSIGPEWPIASRQEDHYGLPVVAI
ncbi:DDE-type integrase/transposase/recombinase [Dactylosporangium darangshiense]|uniref:DDE-type integrase/transposase/recombinase n=1 Tax=Dactylosporangium darangshiense TaxID=579108 RepID=UPI00363A0FB5